MPPSDPGLLPPRRLVSARGVHVIIGNVEHVADDGDLAALLGPDEPSVEGLARPRRAEYLTARRWIRRLVVDRLHRSWHGFEATPRGTKPRLHASALDVSIAHAGDRVVVGVVEHGRIGVDVELVAPVFDQPALARRLCTPGEQSVAAGLAASERPAWLTQLWTVKESYAKALGRGLALDFRTIDAGRLRRDAAVRGVMTPATRVAGTKIAITWVDGAPFPPASPVRATR